MPSRAALLPQIACDSSLPTLFACFYLPRATLCAPQTRRQANLWAPRTSGARPMHPLRSPHPRAASLLRRRRRERLNCIDAAAGPDAGCHAVWRRDASFRSPPRPRGCGRWSTRTARAAGNLLTGVGVTSCHRQVEAGKRTAAAQERRRAVAQEKWWRSRRSYVHSISSPFASPSWTHNSR